jgi:hypothetical protein
MDAGVAGFADNEGLASPPRHDLHALGWIGLSGLIEISELADLVHAHLVRLSAEFAPSGKEPVDQLLAAGGGRDWFAVPQDRELLPPERDTAERRDQWFPARAHGRR